MSFGKKEISDKAEKKIDKEEQNGNAIANESEQDKCTGHELRDKIGNQLRVERWFREMSQSEVAKKLGTEKSNISRIENGKQNMSVDYIQAMADLYDKDVELILSDKQVSYEDNKDYSLKLYDDTLIKFAMWHGDLGLKTEILWVNEDKRKLFPLDLDVSDEGLIEWMKWRSIPSNREMVEDILYALGLESDDLKGIVDICFALSLNDSYWITPSYFEGKFSQYNLYENRFNKTLSLIAYAGYGSTHEKFVTTPELTTGGSLRKAWRNKGADGIWLYKSGTDGFANTGNEPYCEFYASQVAECMGLNSVHYDLERWCHILASKCKLFTDIDTSYIPIGRIVRFGGIDACLDYYKELGDVFYQELVSMLCFDAIILNEDRHYCNFGIIRDNHTGEIIAPAPIFDNGVSLLCYAMQDDFDKKFEKYVNERSNPYGKRHEFLRLAKQLMGPIQKAQIRKLINFRFTESNISNLPTWRLSALEKLIQKRVRELMTE